MEPYVVRRIETLASAKLDEHASSNYRVFLAEPVALLVGILQEVVSSGTGTQAKLRDRQVAGKTGTADQSRDLWFIGFTSDMVTAVWAGSQDNRPIAGKRITGGTVLARVWREYCQAYYRKEPHPIESLIAEKYSDADERKEVVSHSNDTEVSADDGTWGNSPSGNSVTNPYGGVAVKRQKGVTEYNWSE